jgi:hypothetical protein
MSDRLDGRIGDPEPLQCPTDEGAGGKLVLQARVILRPALGHDARTIGVDDPRKFVGSILREAGLHQDFHAPNVRDPEVVLNPDPEAFPGGAEFSGRIGGIPENV